MRLRLALLARSVHPWHGVGGLERHVYDLIRHLTTADVHVTLITQPPKIALPPASDAARELDADAIGVSPDRFRGIVVPYVTFPGAGRRGTTVLDRSTAYPLFGWRAGRVAAALVRDGQVDIVHALGASGLGYATARRAGAVSAPFVFNPQGLEEFGATDPRGAGLKRIAYKPLQAAVTACAREADAVLATDRSLVATVRQHLPIDAARIEIVPNAIDLAAIDARRSADRDVSRGADSVNSEGVTDGAALRQRHEIPPEAAILLSVGRLEENKGFHVLAEALGQVAAAGGRQDWRWVLVGAGPYRPVIERVAARGGLGSHIIFAGRTDDRDLHGWYAASTIFVHPTLYEGSSLVTLEAMAHGRPIIATRAGGLPDKVFPDRNGWLVDARRADALAAAVREALTSPDRCERYGRASRAIVERDFSWPAVVQRLLAVYDRLLTARGQGD